MVAGVHGAGAHANSANIAGGVAGQLQHAIVLRDLHLGQRDARLQLRALSDWRTCAEAHWVGYMEPTLEATKICPAFGPE